MHTYKIRADIFDPQFPNYLYKGDHRKRTEIITMRAANLSNLRKNLIKKFWPSNPYNHPIIHIWADEMDPKDSSKNHLGSLSINLHNDGTIYWRKHNAGSSEVVTVDTRTGETMPRRN